MTAPAASSHGVPPSLSRSEGEVRFQVVLFALGTLLSTVLWAFPVKWCWNLMAHVLPVPRANLWAGMAVVILLRVLQVRRIPGYVIRVLTGGRTMREDWLPVLFPGLMTVLEWAGILSFFRLFRVSSLHSLWKFWSGYSEKRRRRKERWRNFSRDLRQWARGRPFDRSRW